MLGLHPDATPERVTTLDAAGIDLELVLADRVGGAPLAQITQLGIE
jgi:hypothetical protein